MQVYTFPNGLRLLYQPFPSRITHCGFVIDAGSRDETAEEMGMAHFIEHLFFKGTEKRKSIHILNRLEVVGGELNAYTSKDKTCVYAAVNSDYFSRTAELLTDIVFNSSFPDREIDKERKVIHEEIDMYLDTPEENLIDLFQEKAFKNHPLGYNILGSHESLDAFSRDSLLQFYRNWYQPNRMVFVYSGPKSMKQVVRILEPLLNHISEKTNSEKRIRKDFNHQAYTPFSESIQTPHVQTYFSTGGLAPSNSDPDRSAMTLLSNIIGGPGLNSRLNLAIREKNGFAYDIEFSYQSMKDIGLFYIYVGTDLKYYQKSRDLIGKELKFWRTKGLSDSQLHRYKNQLKGQILLGEENRSGLILAYGKMLLDGRSLETLDEVFERIDTIRSTHLVEVANKYFNEEMLSELIFLGR